MTGAGRAGSAAPLAGQAAIVTGGASGIGAAIVRALRDDGAAVTAVDLRAVEGDPASLHADVTDETAVAAAIGTVERRHGRLDLLVNCAGIDGTLGRLEDSTAENFDAVLAVNLRGTFICCKYALPLLTRQRGSIVNIASIAGLVGMPGLGAYGAGKGGVIALTRSCALEYARAGVRVNAVCPGPVETPIAARERERNPDGTRALERRTPLGRFARPEEIAAVAAFLAGPGASYITGAAIPVDGGLTAQ